MLSASKQMKASGCFGQDQPRFGVGFVLFHGGYYHLKSIFAPAMPPAISCQDADFFPRYDYNMNE